MNDASFGGCFLAECACGTGGNGGKVCPEKGAKELGR